MPETENIITDLDVERIRADFPFLTQTVNKHPLVYFDNGATTQHPHSVIEAIRKCYEQDYANVHRGVHELSERATEQYEASRRSLQRFIQAEFPEEIIFTSGTTASINLVAHSLGELLVQKGDAILLTQMEHHSNIVPWQQMAERRGARVLFARVTEDGLLDIEHFEKLLAEQPKIVSFTAVSNVLGTINPVKLLTQLAHRAGATVLIDAAQSVPHEPLSVLDWQADFVAFSGHKMLGPSGVGVLYGRRDLLESMPPFLGGGSMISSVTEDGFTPGELPAKFEAGTPPIVEAIAMQAAVEYLEQIGMPQIRQHELTLTQIAHEVLGEIPSVRILGPAPEQKGGIVSFTVEGLNVQDIAFFVNRHGFAVRPGHHCAMPLHKRFGIPASNRASFYLYNTLDEVRAFGPALQATIKKLRG
jgi:cysteine desulfurase/selenocysteine lyase